MFDPQPSLWRPLPHLIKINVDAAIRQDFLAIAAICRDSSGQVVHAAVRRVACSESTERKAEALKLGIGEALKKGFTSVILEGDSLSVMEAVKAFPLKVDWHVHNIIQEIHALLRSWSFGDVSTPRRVRTMLRVVLLVGPPLNLVQEAPPMLLSNLIF